jgi:predicted metal-dependent hydrolase
MRTQIYLGDISLDVVRKAIKNVHLSVHPPTGTIRIAAPSRMSLDSIRVFAIAKIDWIRRAQIKLSRQERETPRDYIERESHYLWGHRYLLRVVESEDTPAIEIAHSRIVFQVKPEWSAARRDAFFEAWYRTQLKAAVPEVIARWEPLIDVEVKRFFVQRMRTQWGSCNARAGSIRLNTDLAKKPREHLEYIVVHEMVHLLEPTHNANFSARMDQLMPNWRLVRDELNRLPVRFDASECNADE